MKTIKRQAPIDIWINKFRNFKSFEMDINAIQY